MPAALRRLRPLTGSFAIYRASHDDYDESVFPTGLPVGTCQEALDTACGLYLNDPTAWTLTPDELTGEPLSLAFNLCCLPGNSLPVLSGVSP